MGEKARAGELAQRPPGPWCDAVPLDTITRDNAEDAAWPPVMMAAPHGRHVPLTANR